MGRLRVLSGREVCRILERHGFTEVRRRGSHVAMQRGTTDRTVTVPVPDHLELKSAPSCRSSDRAASPEPSSSRRYPADGTQVISGGPSRGGDFSHQELFHIPGEYQPRPEQPPEIWQHSRSQYKHGTNGPRMSRQFHRPQRTTRTMPVALISALGAC